MSIWSAIGSIGSTLLGGLFGRKKQTTSNTVDYVSMVRNAEAAGFNPLTALRNGGAAGFTSTTTPAAPLSSVIGQGLAEGVGKFLETFDPHADKMREKQFALLDAQVRNLDAQSGAIFPAMPGGFHSAGTYGGTYEGRPSGSAGQLSRVTSEGTGLSWAVNPANTPAQEIEDQYAEIPANIVGTANWVDDMSREYLGGSLSTIPTPYEYGRRARRSVLDWWNRSAQEQYEAHRRRFQN